MKNLRTVWVLVYCALSSVVFAQNTYNGLFGAQRFSDKIVPSNNSFVMASFNSAANGFELIKMTNKAEMVWKKTYASTLNNTTLINMNTFWRGVCETQGGYLMAGIGFKPLLPGNLPARWELLIIKTNFKGVQQFIKRHILPVNTAGTVGEVIWNPNTNTFLVVGQLGADMYAAKIRANGDLDWQNTYSEGFGWTAVDHPSGGYLIAGGKHLWQIDEAGDLVIEQEINIFQQSPAGKDYATADRERILSIQVNGFAIMGTAYEGMHSAIYLTRFDWNNGQILSQVYAPTLKTAANDVSVAIQNFTCLGPSFYFVYNDIFMAPAPNTMTLSTGQLKMVRTDLNGHIQAAGNVGNPTQIKFGDFVYKNLKFAYGSTTLKNEYNAYLTDVAPIPIIKPKKR